MTDPTKFVAESYPGKCRLINPSDSGRTLTLLDGVYGVPVVFLPPGGWIHTSNEYVWLEAPTPPGRLRMFVHRFLGRCVRWFGRVPVVGDAFWILFTKWQSLM